MMARRLEFVSIKKPYEIQCDDELTLSLPPEPVEEPDQLSEICPLPFNTNSKVTGCSCNFASLTIDCVYSEALYKIPEFVFVSEMKNVWSVDLRCKNFTHLHDLSGFIPLENIDYLDMSFNETQLECRSSTGALMHLSNFQPLCELGSEQLTFSPDQLNKLSLRVYLKFFFIKNNFLF